MAFTLAMALASQQVAVGAAGTQELRSESDFDWLEAAVTATRAGFMFTMPYRLRTMISTTDVPGGPHLAEIGRLAVASEIDLGLPVVTLR